MGKTVSLWTVLLCFMLLLGGCGKKGSVYTNLADQASENEVFKELENCGATKRQTEKIKKWVNDFNQAAQNFSFPEGFAKLPEEGMDYSTLMMDDSAEAYPYLQWLNCRLTAFFLLKDQISTSETGNDADVWLMFDVEAIDTVSEYRMSEAERADFVTVFNQVPVEGAGSLEAQEERIEEAWKEREVQIKAEGLSLICVYLHAPEDETRFVGHTGVLAETEEGLLFVEKYGPMAPFQATKFQSREELKTYLLERKDLYGDETELAPVVTENGEVME